jgi:hypothetical protein
MKILASILIAICLSVEMIAQKTYDYSDKVYDYNVVVDSVLSGDSVNFECVVKSISILKHLDKKVIQTIIPPENFHFCNLPKEHLFVLEDVNFDKILDFRIIQLIPAGPNIPYYFWVFDDKLQIFQRDTTLEDITSPDFDYEKKIITSSWRSSCCDHGCSTYKYINGKITMIKEFEIADDLENPGQQIITTKELIDGQMKLVELKIEKRDE